MDAIEKLSKKPSFTTKEARKYGVSARMLSYYVKTGKLERLARGVYCSTDYIPGDEFQWEDLAVAAKHIKGGVICLISALNYYELTDEMMREFWIAVDNENSKVKFPKTRIIRMRETDLGVKQIKMAGMKVKIFDAERTIVDTYRLLDFETAIKALKLYLQGATGRPNIKKLNQYANKLRASKLNDHIMALTT